MGDCDLSDMYTYLKPEGCEPAWGLKVFILSRQVFLLQLKKIFSDSVSCKFDSDLLLKYNICRCMYIAMYVHM